LGRKRQISKHSLGGAEDARDGGSGLEIVTLDKAIRDGMSIG
jgi:hypothetical protein